MKIFGRLAFELPLAALALSALVLATGSATAQAPKGDAITAPAQKTIGTPSTRKMASSLMVLNAQGASLQGQKLVLRGVAATAIVFADRPVRSAGHMTTAQLLELWKSGSFAKDPPNATVSVFEKSGAGVSDLVVVLKNPVLDGDRLAFEVLVLEGSLAGGDGPASIFIDTVWWSASPSTGITYLGQTPTTTEDSPAFGSRDNEGDTGSGWANPAPPLRDAPRRRYNSSDYGFAPPPPGAGDRPGPACGQPPLLPCY